VFFLLVSPFFAAVSGLFTVSNLVYNKNLYSNCLPVVAFKLITANTYAADNFSFIVPVFS